MGKKLQVIFKALKVNVCAVMYTPKFLHIGNNIKMSHCTKIAVHMYALTYFIACMQTING